MLKIVFAFITTLASVSFIAAQADHGSELFKVKKSSKIDRVYAQKMDIDVAHTRCPHTTVPNRMYVPYNREKRKQLKSNRSNINVTYENFPAEAERAFAYIVDILEESFPSPVDINLLARYVDGQSGTLASAGPTGFFRLFGGNFPPRTFYPTPLAEKILGEELNEPDEFDIVVNINQNVDNWYYDYENPDDILNQFDFVTVVIHEIFHGLGYLSIANVASGNGAITSGGEYYVYDRFLETGTGEILVEDFEDPSPELGSSLRGSDLFFNSDYYRFFTPNNIPQVYAPSRFSQGSSISHLDQDRYTLTNDALMTPEAAPEQIVHDPGIALQQMYDIGWSATLLEPDFEPLTEDINQDLVVYLDVRSDFGIDTSSLKLFYYSGEFTIPNLNSIDFEENPDGDGFIAVVPAPGEETSINLYFSVRDNRNIRRVNPFNSPQVTYRHTWGPENSVPVIRHQPVTSITEGDEAVLVNAVINDTISGIDSAIVVFNYNGELDSLPMAPVLDQFNTLQYLTIFQIPGGVLETDELSYQILAFDNALNPNIGVWPDSGYYTIEIIDLPDPVMSYENDFDDLDSSDFTGEGFSIRLENGFQDGAIHSVHPYGDANSQGLSSFSYVYQLRFPIIVSATNSTMSYDEIVLVEPGEPNVPYGQPEFWDYVIVEGQKQGETGWRPLVNGYDSQIETTWENAYNNGIPAGGQVSSTIGTPAFYMNRQFDIAANSNINPGDTINIRFRLFSDPLAFGWGWAIDNLNIQGEVTSIQEIKTIEEFVISPNPSTAGRVHLKVGATEPLGNIALEIIDATGAIVQRKSMGRYNTTINEYVDISTLAAGVYYLKIENEEGAKIASFIKQ